MRKSRLIARLIETVLGVAIVIGARPARAVRSEIDPISRAGPTSIHSPALARIIPPDDGRRPSRRVPDSERLAVMKAVDAIFADRSWWQRQQIMHRVVDAVSTSPPLDPWRGEKRLEIVELVAASIERAVEARRSDDAAEVRRAAIDALIGIGWAYRLAGAARPSEESLVAWKRGTVWSGAVLAHLVAIYALGHFDRESGWAALGAFWTIFGSVFNAALFIDVLVGRNFVDYLSRPLGFVAAPAARRAVRTEIAQFWFELERRLSRRDDWRIWVKARARRSGAMGIANDVREFLRALIGVKSLGPVCEELLAPGSLASPF